jgi:hypothetical protein
MLAKLTAPRGGSMQAGKQNRALLAIDWSSAESHLPWVLAGSFGCMFSFVWARFCQSPDFEYTFTLVGNPG